MLMDVALIMKIFPDKVFLNRAFARYVRLLRFYAFHFVEF